ncbi:MAG: hypothetical protein ACXVIZ_01375 [Halobacteriota archaeon]
MQIRRSEEECPSLEPSLRLASAFALLMHSKTILVSWQPSLKPQTYHARQEGEGVTPIFQDADIITSNPNTLGATARKSTAVVRRA